MGLPSGTLWANMNVGATAPEEAGDYFAWGETEPKSMYNWSTYVHCNGSLETCYNYGYEIAGTEYDAATVQWGEPWYMPSWNQINELMENCTKEWTTVNNVNVCKYISKINGKTIFLPAAGHIIEGELKDAGMYGFYWTSSWRSSEVEGVCPLLCAYMNIPWWTFDHRCYGLTVRPVR